MKVSEVSQDIIEENLIKTNEINIGFCIYHECSFFQITNGSYIAYAVIYDLYNQGSDLAELARFFVPKEYRNNGFGKLAAVSIINHLFEKKSKLVVDPLNSSVEFWRKVAGQFKFSVNFEDIGSPKYIWHKI